MNYQFDEQNNLIFYLENEDWDEIHDIDEKDNGNDFAKFWDLMEATRLLGNCPFHAIDPEQTGDLTEAPMIADSPLLEEEDFNEPYNVWWFPSYMIDDLWEELKQNGKILFTFGYQNK